MFKEETFSMDTSKKVLTKKIVLLEMKRLIHPIPIPKSFDDYKVYKNKQLKFDPLFIKSKTMNSDWTCCFFLYFSKSFGATVSICFSVIQRL